MYYYLTGEVKKRIIDELKDSFQDNLTHQDIVPHIRHKYDFEERPKKGIVIQGASGDPEKLSADNFLGEVSSYVMRAKVGDHPGKALEWVREDTRAIRENNGRMPSHPGIYYITIDADENENGTEDYKFHLDPLYTVREEPLITFETGTETTAFLGHGDILEGSVRIRFARTNYQLVSGEAIRVEASESLKFGPADADTYLFGLPEGYVPVSSEGTSTGPFIFQANTNQHVLIWLNGQKLEFDFNPGTLTADEVVSEFDTRLRTLLPPSEYVVENRGGSIYLEASQSLRFGSDADNTSGQLLGFPEGQVGVSVTGHVLPEGIPEQSDFRIEVDGASYQFPIDGGDRPPSEIASDLDARVPGATIDLVDGGDYTVDHGTGEVTFLRDFDEGDRLYASYRYPVPSTEDVPIQQDHSNNTAIPGCILAFGDELRVGDKVAVVVHPNRSNVAYAYGGKWTINLDMQIMAQDPATREDLADHVQMYFFAQKKEKLAEEGLVLQDVSYGGEAEEFYDEQAQIHWYLADISLTILSDWEVHVPKPYFIESVTQTSFGEEVMASDQDREPDFDLVRPQIHRGNASEDYADQVDDQQHRIY